MRRRSFANRGIKVFLILILLIFILDKIGTKSISKTEEYEKRLKENPADIDTIIGLANIYYKKAVYLDDIESVPFLESAIALYENAEELSSSAKTQFLLGKAYFEMTRYVKNKDEFYDKAQKSLLSASRGGLKNEELFILLGHTWLIKGYLNKAISSYNEALSINPKNSITLLNIAFCYKEKGELEKALSILKKIDNLMDKEAYITYHLLLGEIYKKKGLSLLARKEYMKVLKRDKNNKEAKSSLQRLD